MNARHAMLIRTSLETGTGTWTPSYRRTSGSPYSWNRPPCLHWEYRFGIVVTELLAGSSLAGLIERFVADLDLTVALVMSDHDARARNARSCQLVRARRRPFGEQRLAAAEHDREGKNGHRVDEVVGQKRIDEFGAALGEKIRAVFVSQTLYVGNAAQEHRALPARVDLA